MNDPDQIPPDDDLERIMLDGLPEEEALTIEDPSPALRELVEIAVQLDDGDLGLVLALAREYHRIGTAVENLLRRRGTPGSR